MLIVGPDDGDEMYYTIGVMDIPSPGTIRVGGELSVLCGQMNVTFCWVWVWIDAVMFKEDDYVMSHIIISTRSSFHADVCVRCKFMIQRTN